MAQSTLRPCRSVLALALLLAVPAGATARVRNRTDVEIWLWLPHGARVLVPVGGYADLEPAPAGEPAAAGPGGGAGSLDTAPVKGARFLVMAVDPREGCRIDCTLVLPGPGPEGGLASFPHDARPANLTPAPDEPGPDSHPIRVWDFHGLSVTAGERPATPMVPDGMAFGRPESLSPGFGGPGGRFSPLPMPALGSSQASPSRAGTRSAAASPATVKRYFSRPPFLALDREGRRIPDLAALSGVKDLRGMTFMPNADLGKLDIGSVQLDGADVSETLVLPSTQVPLLQARGLLPAEGDAFDPGKGHEVTLPDLGPVVEWCRNYKRLISYVWHTGKLDPRPISNYVWEQGVADWKLEQHARRDQLQPWQKELLAFIEGMTEFVDTGETPPALSRRQPGQDAPRPVTPRKVKVMDPEDKSWSRSHVGRSRPRTPVKRKLADTDDRTGSPSPTKHPRTPTRPGNPPTSLTPPPAGPRTRSAAARHPGAPSSSFTPPPVWPQARSAAAPVLPAPSGSAATVPMAPKPLATRLQSARNLFGAGGKPQGPMFTGSGAGPGQAAPAAGLEPPFQGLLGPTSHFHVPPPLSRPPSPQALAMAPERTASPGHRPLSPPGLPSLGELGLRPLSPVAASSTPLERREDPFPIEPSSLFPDTHPFEPHSLAPAPGAADGSEEGSLPLQGVVLWPEITGAGGDEGDW